MAEPENDSISVDDLLAALGAAPASPRGASEIPEDSASSGNASEASSASKSSTAASRSSHGNIEDTAKESKRASRTSPSASSSASDQDEGEDERDDVGEIDLLAALGIPSPEPKLYAPEAMEPDRPKTTPVERARIREAAKHEQHIRSRQWQEEEKRKEQERIRLAGEASPTDEEIFDRAAASYRRAVLPPKSTLSIGPSSPVAPSVTTSSREASEGASVPSHPVPAQPFGAFQGGMQPMQTIQPTQPTYSVQSAQRGATLERTPFPMQPAPGAQGASGVQPRGTETAAAAASGQPMLQSGQLRTFVHAPMGDFGFTKKVVNGQSETSLPPSQEADLASPPTQSEDKDIRSDFITFPETIERRDFSGETAERSLSIQRLGASEATTETETESEEVKTGVFDTGDSESSDVESAPQVVPVVVPVVLGQGTGGQTTPASSAAPLAAPLSSAPMGMPSTDQSQPIPAGMSAPLPVQPSMPMGVAQPSASTAAPMPPLPQGVQGQPVMGASGQFNPVPMGTPPLPSGDYFGGTPVADSAFFDGRGVFRERQTAQDTLNDAAGSRRNNVLGIILIIVAVLCAVMAVALLTGIFNFGATSTSTSTSSNTPAPSSAPANANTGPEAANGEAGETSAETQVVYSYVIRGVDGSTHEATETARFNADGILQESTIEVMVQGQEAADALAAELEEEFGTSVKSIEATDSHVLVTLDIGRDDLTQEAYTELLAANMLEFSVVE